MNLFDQFYHRLPVRDSGADEHLHLLNEEEIRRINRCQLLAICAGALLSVLGFLAYYLPVYWFPHLFPATDTTAPIIGATIRLPWGELLWCVLLTSIELFLLTLLNIAGVHQIAAATGFITPDTKAEKGEAVMQIGLEKKSTEVSRYGIDPYQGLNKWLLFLFNLILRLKGWLGNQVVRYLLRLLLGRYAVRSVLDFSGLPIYMAINAYSVHAVMREAKVIIMGQAVISFLVKRLPQVELSAAEQKLLYDTLQYIAVSKRDFHQNHYLLTRQLLDFYHIPGEKHHQLPEDYLEKLKDAPLGISALCLIVIILGFILDGRLSWRERLKLRKLNHLGIMRESYPDVRRYLDDFMNGASVDRWSESYLHTLEE